MDRNAVITQMEPLTKSKLKKVDHRGGARVIFADDTAVIRPSRGAKAIPFTDEGYGTLLNFMGVPLPMARVLSPDTRNRVANEILDHKDQYAVVVRDNTVTGIAKQAQVRNAINPERVMKTLDKTAKGVEYNRLMILDGSRARLEVVTEKQQEVDKGDLIQAGAVIDFSPLGITVPSVESYCLRLACTNGMTTNDVYRKYGAGDGDDVWQFFRNSVKEAIKSVVGIARRFHQMIEEGIPAHERAMVIEAMIKEAKLPPKIADAIRARAIETPPENAWQAMNLITYASSHDDMEPIRVIRAQRAAAKFASESEHAKICPACRRNR